MQRSRTPRVPNARARFPDDSPAPSGESYDALAKRLAATDAKLEQLTALLQQLASAGLPNVPPADVPAASNAANEPRSPALLGGSWESVLECGVHIITYNCNSLAPNAPLVLALDADIIALQETRITEKQSKVLAAQADAHNYVLFIGPHANQTSRAKLPVTDRSFPGVAVLVRKTLTAVSVHPPEDMLIWHSKGMFLLVDIFLEGRWVTFCTC